MGQLLILGVQKQQMFYADQGVPEGTKFILGTDNLGRSIAKRIIVGVRISLLIAIVATFD